MQASQEKAIKTLNSLIETTLDSAHGYEEAAENARNEELRTLFAERSRRRTDLAHQLQEEVRSFGGKPQDSQSMLGKAHNKFVDLKNAVAGGDSDKAVVNEVERGEDVIKAKFRKALDDEDLPTNARQTVSRAYESIRVDHDEISQLKHSMH